MCQVADFTSLWNWYGMLMQGKDPQPPLRVRPYQEYPPVENRGAVPTPGTAPRFLWEKPKRGAKGGCSVDKKCRFRYNSTKYVCRRTDGGEGGGAAREGGDGS